MVFTDLPGFFSSNASLFRQYGITNEQHYDSVTAEYYFPKPQDTPRTSWFSNYLENQMSLRLDGFPASWKTAPDKSAQPSDCADSRTAPWS